MNNGVVIDFHKGMMRLIGISRFEGERLTELLNAINAIRAHYPWSQNIYDESGLRDVYVISCQKITFGFIECSYRNLDIVSSEPLSIFLAELHIAPSMQRKGVGAAVLEHLLKKGLSIEMVVANENKKMLALVDKFNPEHKHILKDTRTVTLRPK